MARNIAQKLALDLSTELLFRPLDAIIEFRFGLDLDHRSRTREFLIRAPYYTNSCAYVYLHLFVLTYYPQLTCFRSVQIGLGIKLTDLLYL